MPNKVTDYLREIGAEKIRSKRHNIYQLPNGRRIAIAQTSSDFRAEQNQLKDIRAALGLTPSTFQEGERRTKKIRPGREVLPQYEKVATGETPHSLTCRCIRCQLKRELKIVPPNGK